MDVSDVFFPARWRRRGVRGTGGEGGGGDSFLENPRGGGSPGWVGGGGEAPGGCLQELGGGGGLNIFCSGPKFPPRRDFDFV